jgi:acyl-CoA synthetase (AMP-forming)/AMP-acid ligase II
MTIFRSPFFHGVLAAGAAASPVNALYTAAELADQLRDAGARGLRKVAALAKLDAANWTPRELRHSFVSLLFRRWHADWRREQLIARSSPRFLPQGSGDHLGARIEFHRVRPIPPPRRRR